MDVIIYDESDVNQDYIATDDFFCRFQIDVKTKKLTVCPLGDISLKTNLQPILYLFIDFDSRWRITHAAYCHMHLW